MELTHLKNGKPRMVDVGKKEITNRVAIASGKIFMREETKKAILENRVKKGGVLYTAIVAGISGAKKTSELIPMCHNILIDGVEIDIKEIKEGFEVVAEVKTSSKTGVEMEALSAVSIALLTIYDMAKALERGMVISDIKLEYKSGGKSGEFRRN